jgi:integrase
VDALDEHLRSHPAGPDDLVFRSPTGAPFRLTNWRRRAWYPAVKKAAVGGLRVHDLRHTAVALWIEAGAPRPKRSRPGLDTPLSDSPSTAVAI